MSALQVKYPEKPPRGSSPKLRERPRRGPLLRTAIFLAKAFGVAKSQVILESGELNRHKRLRIRAPKSLPPIPGLQRP